VGGLLSMTPPGKYQVIETSLADTRRLLEYKLTAQPEIHLNLKGFDCGWILRSGEWRPGLRVLDVGAGYSWLPVYLAREKHCEVWSVDDFGTWGSDQFWERSRDPEEHIRAHPEVKYVLGRLGEDRKPDLPSGYFDCIYSASALEHVPPDRFAAVWKHMDDLLREGGHMLRTFSWRRCTTSSIQSCRGPCEHVSSSRPLTPVCVPRSVRWGLRREGSAGGWM
jgi:SAM-dependent methyltransferase